MDNKELKATQVLQEAEQKRIRDCTDEIAKVLEKYGCLLIPEVRIVGHQIQSQTRIVVRKDQRDLALLPGGNNNPMVE